MIFSNFIPLHQIHRALTGRDLREPLLTALASKVVVQQEMVKNLDIWSVACDNKECAEAFATLVEHSSE